MTPSFPQHRNVFGICHLHLINIMPVWKTLQWTDVLEFLLSSWKDTTFAVYLKINSDSKWMLQNCSHFIKISPSLWNGLSKVLFFYWYLILFDTVGGCWGQPMLVFWKLVDEAQMSKSLEATRHHDSTKLLTLLPLRAI